MLAAHGSTGVLRATSLAVAAARPVCIHPVQSLDTLEAVGAARGGTDGTLKAARLFRRGSTVEDVFKALLRAGHVGGDLIRCEALAEGGGRRQVPKDQQLADGHVLRLMTNKKVAWQERRPGAGGAAAGADGSPSS